MRVLALKSLPKMDAAATVALRIGVVGLNFTVMIWLTATQGLDVFGAIIFLWGAAFVASAVVSCGGPLVLLRALSGGSVLRPLQIALIAVGLPGGLCCALWLLAQQIIPDDRWLTVLLVAFCANLLTCLASVMRAWGSVQASMVLRDAGPFAALGLASLIAPAAGTAMLLWTASGLMCVMAVAASVWCIRHRPKPADAPQPFGTWWSSALWGTSVLGMVIVQIDLIIGGMLMSPEAVGLYAFLRRIANVVALPVSVANWVSARPIAAAYGAGDQAALRQASARGNKIAWYPALLIAAVCALGLWIGAAGDWFTVTSQMTACFGILVLGALAQAFMASGFSVATLSDHAWLSAAARATTVLVYLGLAVMVGADMTPVNNALIYVLAMAVGNGLVWVCLLRDLDVDTSALVLLDRGVRRWKTG